MNTGKYREQGAVLEKELRLRYSPIALRFIKDESEIPSGFERPSKDLNGKLCACQAYAAVRRERRRLALMENDHACVWFMIGAGMVDFDDKDYCSAKKELFDGGENLEYNLFIKDPEKSKEFFASTFPRMDKGSCRGILLAPLDITDFEPDVVLIYARPAQVRTLLMAVKYTTGKIVESSLDSVESCLYSTVAVLKSNDYRITVPDPGEYKRAYCDEDELIFSAPASRLDELCGTLNEMESMGLGYTQMNKDMSTMPTDGFYEKLLKSWGID